MADLHVVAVLPAKPGSEEIVRDALTTLARETQAEEGCISYTLHESLAAPGSFVTVEVWTGQDALDAHMASPHVAAALGVAGEHLAGPPAIHPLSAPLL